MYRTIDADGRWTICTQRGDPVLGPTRDERQLKEWCRVNGYGWPLEMWRPHAQKRPDSEEPGRVAD